MSISKNKKWAFYLYFKASKGLSLPARLAGKTPDGENFLVQIKETIKNGQKWLISIFPIDK